VEIGLVVWQTFLSIWLILSGRKTAAVCRYKSALCGKCRSRLIIIGTASQWPTCLNSMPRCAWAIVDRRVTRVIMSYNWLGESTIEYVLQEPHQHTSTLIFHGCIFLRLLNNNRWWELKWMLQRTQWPQEEAWWIGKIQISLFQYFVCTMLRHRSLSAVL